MLVSCTGSNKDFISGSVVNITRPDWIVRLALAGQLAPEDQNIDNAGSSVIRGLLRGDVTDLTLYEDDSFAFFIRKDGSTHCGSKRLGGAVSNVNRILVLI
eukprot:TRINITY_DN6806_c0_g1_i1.p1 TRINITY_DN6806_c0_g1~~TRINITY_DN6806_c0_g1_i1.p1  ORF type:complete len:101 (+),score=21.71 TRINITY_DN6806_c0_g1_i1:1598-1900(+)